MKTSQQARAAYEIAKKGNAARDPFVRSVLERFPGAEIIDVRIVEEGANCIWAPPTGRQASYHSSDSTALAAAALRKKPDRA